MAGFKGRYLPEYLAVSHKACRAQLASEGRGCGGCQPCSACTLQSRQMPSVGSLSMACLACYLLGLATWCTKAFASSPSAVQCLVWSCCCAVLQIGEAPEEVRAVMRQRSRWCKGHMQVRLAGFPCTAPSLATHNHLQIPALQSMIGTMLEVLMLFAGMFCCGTQVFFSSRCPLFQHRLSFMHKMLYTNGEPPYGWDILCTHHGFGLLCFMLYALVCMQSFRCQAPHWALHNAHGIS